MLDTAHGYKVKHWIEYTHTASELFAVGTIYPKWFFEVDSHSHSTSTINPRYILNKSHVRMYIKPPSVIHMHTHSRATFNALINSYSLNDDYLMN